MRARMGRGTRTKSNAIVIVDPELHLNLNLNLNLDSDLNVNVDVNLVTCLIGPLKMRLKFTLQHSMRHANHRFHFSRWQD